MQEIHEFVNKHYNQLFSELDENGILNRCRSREDINTQLIHYAEDLHILNDLDRYKNV